MTINRKWGEKKHHRHWQTDRGNRVASLLKIVQQNNWIGISELCKKFLKERVIRKTLVFKEEFLNQNNAFLMIYNYIFLVAKLLYKCWVVG